MSNASSSSGSITSLLNSLHSHLQSQTQLLPTLHNQLGLPDTALEDELSSLQRTLTQCVEDQIDGRRKEVEMWLRKCEDVEEECARYHLALGAYASSSSKGITGIVAESRKEHVLPKRYEMLFEMQEKLRQVSYCSYHLFLPFIYISSLRSDVTEVTRLNASPPIDNAATFIPHAAIRILVLSTVQKPARDIMVARHIALPSGTLDSVQNFLTRCQRPCSLRDIHYPLLERWRTTGEIELAERRQIHLDS